jgi:beta-galactosidase/beta-glucuronidase
MKKARYLLLFVLPVLWTSCSHTYDSDVQNLDFYQWNLWEDPVAGPDDVQPSCGWEDLHRGMGKLVRIPASLEEHFPDREGTAVFWYHCRFTLPEQWEEMPIFLDFKEAGPVITLFLNEEEVKVLQGEKAAFEVDVSESIYYTRDNHLSIRISNPKGASPEQLTGISGTIVIKPDLEGDKKQGVKE